MSDWLPLIVVLIAVVVAFKLFKGVIKIGVILALIAFAAYWFLGMAA